MKTKIVKLEELNPAKYNPRVLLESGSKEYKALIKSLDKFGTVEPIVINERNNTIIGGHQRYNALKELGKETAEVVLVNCDEKTEKKLNLALNKIEGKWDFMKLDELLTEMSDEELSFTGFLNEETNFLEEDVKVDNTKAQKAAEDKERKEKQFQIFFSFEDRETANVYLKRFNLEGEFTEQNNSIVIHIGEME